jgi:hypothetical protein
MHPKLQDLLCNQYPTLYQGLQKNGEKMVFKCGNGWLTLIDTVSALIVKRSPGTVATHVNEECGSLIVGISDCAPKDYDYLFGIISMSYWLSLIICKKCFNSSGLSARCELYDKGHQNNIEYDATEDLPFEIKVRGLAWRLMIIEFYDLIQLHIKSNDMPAVAIKCVDKINDKLWIDFTGGDEVTQGMAALLLAYAARIDEDTGDALNP